MLVQRYIRTGYQLISRPTSMSLIAMGCRSQMKFQTCLDVTSRVRPPCLVGRRGPVHNVPIELKWSITLSLSRSAKYIVDFASLFTLCKNSKNLGQRHLGSPGIEFGATTTHSETPTVHQEMRQAQQGTIRCTAIVPHASSAALEFIGSFSAVSSQMSSHANTLIKFLYPCDQLAPKTECFPAATNTRLTSRRFWLPPCTSRFTAEGMSAG